MDMGSYIKKYIVLYGYGIIHKVHSIIWIWDRNKTYFSEKNDMDYYDGKYPPTRNYVDWKRNDFEADKGNDQTRQH